MKSSWNTVKLGDIGSTITGLSGKTKKDFGTGAPFVTYKNVYSNTFIDNNIHDYVEVSTGEKQSKLKKGDILFTTSSENPEEVGMSSVLINEPVGDLYLNSFCFGLRFEDESIMDSRFAGYLFRGSKFRSAMERSAKGTTRFNLSKRDFLKTEITVPPITTQKRIAEILLTTDEAIALTEEMISKSELLKIGLMQKFFNRDRSTSIKKIRDIADVKSGGTPSRGNELYWQAGTIPWVKTAEINYSNISHTSESITEEGLKNSAARIFPKGTILMAMYGQGKTRGKVSILDIDAATNQACAAFLIRDKQILTEYLYYYFVHSYHQLRNEAHGANQKNLSGDILKEQTVPIVSLDRQVEIVNVLKAIDDKINSDKVIKRAQQKLKNGLMRDLLSGKVSV